MKEIDLMIFDLDGTLAATGEDLVKSVNYTLKTLNIEEKSHKDIISYVGDGVSQLIQRSLGEKNRGLQEDAMKIFSDYYGEHLLDSTVLYPHVIQVLENFKDKKKVVLTNKRIQFALMIIKRLEIENYFEEIVGGDSTPFCKPDGRVVEYILDQYRTDRNKTLMIGDGVNDIRVAKNSDILNCVLLNGLGNRDDLMNLKADYYCEDLIEMNTLFR